MAVVPGVSYAFQPMLSTRTGRLVALEVLARPDAGSVHDLLRRAANAGQLVETDIALAEGAVHAAADQEHPLHVNVLALTATRPDELLDALTGALRATGRDPKDVTIEITPPFGGISRGALFDGLHTLRRNGFRLAFDGAGDGDLPLSLLADFVPDMVKLDGYLLRGVPQEAGVVAVVEALVHLSGRTGIKLAAVGVETEEQLVAIGRLGVPVAQGNLLAAARRGGQAVVPSQVTTLTRLDSAPATGQGVPLVADLLRPAVTMSDTATSDQVRDAFVEAPEVTGVVLVDGAGRPSHTVDRSRFLLAVTGPYGHALHASRPAARHADPPRTIRSDATSQDLLESVGETEGSRAADDVVVIDAAGRCVGVVRLTEVVRVVADAKVEQAAALNPLTRLPGTGAVAREIDRRVERGEMFVVSWLDVDAFKAVNDTKGFAAGDDLIRALGLALTDAEASLGDTVVAHVGGDDFLVVTGLDEIATVATELVDRAWTVEDLTVSVSLASLVCAVASVGSYREASRLLAPLKQRAKAVPGSSWVLGRPGNDRVDVLRGRLQDSGRPVDRPA
ncbi:GGDEF domain-containing protein [Actinophytocola gossypii]|uniref:GGDEF domain-containing protein n=1 Tax=Actinophytocola gossypii TaxID=2812003 RepID=A0ABT2J694_9PSEU|nr:GGDEF domain-containing protein [Actinophytocola gossypii]MCT2583308.1 GGDEF domain-containing protein [Actinophytocola gossypii]